MKDIISTVIMYVVLTGGLIIGTHYNNALANISIFFTWWLIVLMIVVVFIPSEGLFKSGAVAGKWKRVLFAGHLITMIATGWLVTATLYSVGWFFLWAKREQWLNENK